MKPGYFDTILNNNKEIQPTKRGKKSMVWEDFTTKDIGDGETRAFYMICKKDFAYIKDTPRRCKKYTPQRGSRTALIPVAFDSERYRHDSESVAQESLHVCQEMVKKVRDCVKYVKALKALKEYFPDLKQLHVLNTRNLSLDDQTKWNTTYEMLLAASELKEEFSRLHTLDSDYFKNPSVDEGIHQLFLDYAAGGVTGHLSNGDGHGLGLIDFENFSMESASQQSKSELDQYLKESLLPRSHEFDVMRWCTLKPQMVEALYYAKDWLRTKSIESMDSLVKMEFQI
uniref:Zinc finger BED domain-containing protein DAYSLEEPER-like n=1 Tax=Tanacetum cinerariifolium TaxID=118510 RepID=A0A6L2KJJ8_TANCI|nr:zinc finger BED domain-containing protein DAYSLEEPER-like [Tanacetum cinerariifolium]